MRKSLILISMVALSSVALAQSGSWYAGGVVGFASNTDKDANDVKSVSSSWAFGPEVGTFLKDDIQVGIALGISGGKEENDGTETQSSSTISPTIYGRKFFKVTDNFNTFGGLYLSYLGGKTTDKTGPSDVEIKQSGFGARVGVGVTYALSSKFTVVGQYGLVGFTTASNKADGNDAGSSSSFDFGVNTVGSSTLVQGNGSGSVFNVGIYYTFMSK